MSTLWRDLRYGIRMLGKSPGFSAVVVFSLALGIGANVSIFTIVNALLLRPLAAARPQELAAVYTSDYSGPLYGTSSYPDYLDFRARAQSFDGLVAYAPHSVVMTTNGAQPERLQGEYVSGNYFDVFGVRAAQGRTFNAEEDREAGAHPVVVLSQRFWQKRFDSAPDLIGKQIVLSNQSFTVIGVAPPQWRGMVRGLGVDFWMPMAMEPIINPGSEMLTSRGSRGLFIMGRLRPGVTLEQARAEFNVIAGQQREAYTQQWSNVRNEGRTITLLPESETRIMPQLRGAVLGFMGLLMAVVGLVLAVACANIAGLLLARATSRRREIAIRLALGASRARLMRQLLTESLLLSLVGGALGILVALWATDLLLKFRPPFGVTLALDLGLDARVLGFTLLTAIITGLAFGLAPAVQATKPELVPALKDEGAAGGYRRSRLRSLLVVAQVAVSLLLLIGSGLFLRSLMNANAIDPGFNPQNMLLVDVELRDYKEAQGVSFYQQLLERVRALPGVSAASWSGELPLQLQGSRRGVRFEGYQPQPGEDMEVAFSSAGPEYFRTMGITLLRGRDFSERDTAGAPGVVVINEALARRYFPGQDALGRHLSISGPKGPFLEIVGIARDGKYWTLGEEARPFMTFPLLQNYEGAATLMIRTEGDPQSLVSPVRGEIRTLDQNVLVDSAKTMTEHMGLALLPARVAGSVLGVFGLVALVLASIGIYGVVAFYVGQRTREFGIRVALGAQAGDILGLVLKEGMLIVAVGVALGLAGAFAVTRLLSSFLYGISPGDPLTFTSVSLLLVGVALLACLVPARRATKVDPMVALRYE
ncbi:MAG: ABC transporter permease [Acidobacteria bacterium]|nr:ABC transporter permease [Acidobacteriota bacterium]